MKKNVFIGLWPASLYILIFVIIPSAILAHFFLAYNSSNSIPVGWYFVYPCKPKVDDIVLFEPPETIKSVSYSRGYLTPGTLLIKPVIASSGDLVCLQESIVSINHKAMARILSKDSFGRNLPSIELCRALKQDEIFVLAVTENHSLDGRYFGVLKRENVVRCGVKL